MSAAFNTTFHENNDNNWKGKETLILPPQFSGVRDTRKSCDKKNITYVHTSVPHQCVPRQETIFPAWISIKSAFIFIVIKIYLGQLPIYNVWLKVLLFGHTYPIAIRSGFARTLTIKMIIFIDVSVAMFEMIKFGFEKITYLQTDIQCQTALSTFIYLYYHKFNPL